MSLASYGSYGRNSVKFASMIRILVALIGFFLLSFTSQKIEVLYRSLDPYSLSKHLAFYQLFPETAEGKKALEEAWTLLSGDSYQSPLTYLPSDSINSIVSLVTQVEGSSTPLLKPAELSAIKALAQHLPNRKLKGYYATSEEEVLNLPFHEVDLSRGLLLAQGSDSYESYEALIDLMALQILTRAPLSASPQKKIREINRFIFQEMGYRFPPHSVYAKDIDLYTYLPSVIDSRRGVCLGVSILYLALSQRLGLPLEAVTPPGHIYVRYQGPPTRNIETTARGIHIGTEDYLGIENTSLPVRNIKEVIGLAFFNEAAVHWQNENYLKALNCYEKALVYLPNDLFLQELMGYNYLFVGEKEKGDCLIQKVYASNSKDQDRSLMEDYIHGKVDAEGIRTLFLHVDEKRESLLNKKAKLEAILNKWPLFRQGHFHLAVVLIQLHRLGAALDTLYAYEKLDSNDPSAEFLMAEINAARSNFPAAWKHLNQAKTLLKDRDELPKTIRHFQQALSAHSPE